MCAPRVSVKTKPHQAREKLRRAALKVLSKKFDDDACFNQVRQLIRAEEQRAVGQARKENRNRGGHQWIAAEYYFRELRLANLLVDGHQARTQLRRIGQWRLERKCDLLDLTKIVATQDHLDETALQCDGFQNGIGNFPGATAAALLLGQVMPVRLAMA